MEKESDTKNCQRKDQYYGWITPLLERLVFWISWPSESLLGPRIERGKVQILENTDSRTKRVDTYIAVAIVLEILVLWFLDLDVSCTWLFSFLRKFAVLLMVWRILECSAWAFRVSLFDGTYIPPGDDHYVASIQRIVILGIFSYIEVGLCFGGIYIFGAANLKPPVDSLNAIYFSFITQLTIGYGDIEPTGWSKIIVCIQGLVGILLLVCYVSHFVGLLPRLESARRENVSSPKQPDDKSDPKITEN